MFTERHRLAIEPRSGIWLMFYETLIGCFYKQQLIRVFNDKGTAERDALFVTADRHIAVGLIVRDDSEKNVMVRTKGENHAEEKRADGLD